MRRHDPEAAVAKSFLHHRLGATAFGIGRGHVMGVGALSGSE